MADCRDWKAWHDRMPGKEPTLHVTATCTFPTPGYEVRLEPFEPQGANPADYLLLMVVSEPSGPQPEVITDVPVNYVEETEDHYDTISIQPDGPAGIPVEQVS